MSQPRLSIDKWLYYYPRTRTHESSDVQVALSLSLSLSLSLTHTHTHTFCISATFYHPLLFTSINVYHCLYTSSSFSHIHTNRNAPLSHIYRERDTHIHKKTDLLTLCIILPLTLLPCDHYFFPQLFYLAIHSLFFVPYLSLSLSRLSLSLFLSSSCTHTLAVSFEIQE